jgi:uncharacterized protein YeaO (DUF488 family)
MIQVKRIYDAPAASDGMRILVDRLWPRGVSKARASLDDWLKDVATSPELRVWFNHDPAKFTEFAGRYTEELTRNPAVKELAKTAAKRGTVTLLFAAKDSGINHAVVLQKFLRHHM